MYYIINEEMNVVVSAHRVERCAEDELARRRTKVGVGGCVLRIVRARNERRAQVQCMLMRIAEKGGKSG